MNDYKEKIKDCIDYLNSVRYPCNDWKEDKVYFDRLEKFFSTDTADEETRQLLEELRKLINEKQVLCLNTNKTAEELFAGWNDD